MVNSPIILYVEDDPKSRTVLELIVRKRMQMEQITVFEDSSDFEARVQALDPVPDIVLLDIHVKPLDGFAMLACLRRLDAFRDKPIIALTASVMNEEVHQLKEAGFNGCLGKPLNMQVFPDLFARILNGEQVWYIP